MNRIVTRLTVLGAGLLAVMWVIGYSSSRVSAVPVIPTGTVLVGTGNGLYSEFTQTGTFLASFDTTTGSDEETGCGFDSSGNLITTNFEANNASEFDSSGALIGPFGSGFNFNPESVTFDSAGNVYIGQADGTHEILEFTATGTPVTTFSPAVEQRGTDWIDLAADQCTMFYTSEGVNIHRFDICTNTQGPTFNLLPLPGAEAFALRVRPNGEVLVADMLGVIRLDAAGNQVQTYLFPGMSDLFALSLDPDGTSFWTADGATGTVFKVDIASGAVLQHWSAAGAPGFNDVAGLCVKNEIVVSRPTPTPVCSGAAASVPTLWPPNHKYVPETVTGVTDEACGGVTTITISSVFQDQSPIARGSGHTCPDARDVPGSTVNVRAERSGGGDDGRVYHLGFTATDCNGNSCSGSVLVCVPHDQGEDNQCVDHGALFDSTVCP